MEPGSAPYKERIQALEYLHNLGYKTWVSIEPYPTPNFIEQDLGEILKELSFVDKIIFGRLNYNAKVSQYKDYKNFFNKYKDESILARDIAVGISEIDSRLKLYESDRDAVFAILDSLC